MKNVILIIFAAIPMVLLAQVPQGIPYQAIARNSSGNILANQNIRVRFTIRDSVATGVIKYQETFTPTTNTLGLFNVNVGMGTVVSGTFSGINWGGNAKYMQVEMDPAGGTAYVDMGTTQMMSVPYALHAGSTSAAAGYTHYLGEYYGGGVIFELWKDNSGNEHGLISAVKDLSDGVIWGACNVALAQSSWNGAANTAEIVAYSPCGTVSAAKTCDTSTAAGYTDWYLPSRHELSLMLTRIYYIEKTAASIPGGTSIQDAIYWSSTSREASAAGGAWVLQFANGDTFSTSKGSPYRVRAIRQF